MSENNEVMAWGNRGMSETKHTPGPWVLEGGRNFKTPSGEFYLAYGLDKYGNPLFKNFCELDMNARLIAAAPELLEACRKFITARSFQHEALENVALEVARAAVLKAIGE